MQKSNAKQKIVGERFGIPSFEITHEDARCDLRNFRAEGWEIPEELTPELYAELWNEFCD